MVIPLLAAELAKLRRRPAVIVLAAVLAAAVLVVGYVLGYVVLLLTVGDDPLAAAAAAESFEAYLPGGVPVTMAGVGVALGGPLAFVIGVLVVGSEYGWGTMATLAVQGPSRWLLHSAKAVAVVLAAALLSVLLLVVTVIGSLIVTAIADEAMTVPAAGETLGAFVAVWAITATWALLGVALGTVLRGNGIAIGVGLVYALVLESVLGAVPADGGAVQTVQALTITENARALATGLAGGTGAFAGSGDPLVDTTRAGLTLALYAVAALALAMAVFTRRDLT